MSINLILLVSGLIVVLSYGWFNKQLFVNRTYIMGKILNPSTLRSRQRRRKPLLAMVFVLMCSLF